MLWYWRLACFAWVDVGKRSTFDIRCMFSISRSCLTCRHLECTAEVCALPKLICWLLQEDFGLPFSTILHGRGAGHDVVSPEANGRGQGVCLNRQNSMGQATDSLDHRARACYLPCGLCKMNFVMPLAYTHSWFPPPHYWICFTLSQSRPTSLLSKNRCASLTN